MPADAVERGTRVYLRHPGLDDAGEFLAMVAASRELYAGWIHPPESPEDFRAWVARAERRSRAAFLVCTAGEGQIAGVFNLVEISPNLRTAYCTYYANVAFAGRGLMSEGLELLLRHAFGTLGLHAIGASIQPPNAASIAIVQRAGFRPEKAPPRYLRLAGHWRGHPTWSITVQRWRQLAEAREGGA